MLVVIYVLAGEREMRWLIILVYNHDGFSSLMRIDDVDVNLAKPSESAQIGDERPTKLRKSMHYVTWPEFYNNCPDVIPPLHILDTRSVRG